MEAGEDQGIGALRRSEELYARAFLQNPVPMTLTNAETSRFTAANEEFLRLVGFWRAEVIGATSAELGLWPDYGERARVGERLQSDGVVGPVHGGMRRKDGEIVACVFWFRLLKIESGQAVLTVLAPTEQLKSKS